MHATTKQVELTYTEAQDEMFFRIPEGTKYQIVTKGRRFGATRGACHAFIEWALDGQHLLWGDTINGNIDRYYQRYFLPALKNSNVSYKYQQQQKQLVIEKGYIDFRSADRPENWEGFGYDKIFLNEAGIILKNDYLYMHAVLPMMMDSAKSVLIAAGVPKGKTTKDRKEHAFYTLYKFAKNKQFSYNLLEYSSYDNPLLPRAEAEMLEAEIRRMNPSIVEQEIYGKFVDIGETTLWTPQLLKHVDKVPELRRVMVGVDPSGSAQGDEAGIVSGGICDKGNIYILSDYSGRYSPLQWGQMCVNEYNRQKADSVVVERNFGGDMVRANILSIDKKVRVRDVVATRSKQVRAEPVVSLYEQGRVFHTHGLNGLENEMLTWAPGFGKSPNRIDALVWLITGLMGKSTTSIKELDGYFY